MLHTVISKRKMFPSHREAALGSTESWGEGHLLGKELGSVAAGTVLQRSRPLGQHGLSRPGHYGTHTLKTLAGCDPPSLLPWGAGSRIL